MMFSILFAGINVLLLSFLFLTKRTDVDVPISRYSTVVIGDVIGLTIIGYAFGSVFQTINFDAVLVTFTGLIAFGITLLLHQSYKFNTLNRSNSGYIDGRITFHGRLHLLYSFYQLFIISLLVFTLVETNMFNYVFLLGGLIYLFSVYLDTRKGLLFVQRVSNLE